MNTAPAGALNTCGRFHDQTYKRGPNMAKKSMSNNPAGRKPRIELSPQSSAAADLVCQAIDLLDCGRVHDGYKLLRRVALLLPDAGHRASRHNPYDQPPRAGRGFGG